MEETTVSHFIHRSSFGNISEFNQTSSGSVLKNFYPLLVAELGLSILCSLALIIIYIVIAEHQTVPGKNIISISCCLIVTYVLLIIDLLLRESISRAVCQGIGITVQTTFLATFFWTNVMSYDIMKTLASVKLESERTSFWKYSLYAWGMTFVCVIPTVLLDHAEFVPLQYKPNFGLQKCWLSGQVAYLIYFNMPVGITLFANCVFFGMTARTIVKVRNATTILAANRHKKRFRLCIKLVLIMGLVWITEFIPSLTGIYYLYAIAGMLNCLHGVYFFLIFACKKRTFKQFCSSNCFCCISITHRGRKQSPSLETITTLAY